MKKIVSVNKKGVVKGKKVGKAKITAKTLDGSDKEATFNVEVIKNASGTCDIKDFSLASNGVNYNIECNNAKVKSIKYKVGSSDYKDLITKKLNDKLYLSKKDLEKKVYLMIGTFSGIETDCSSVSRIY